MLPAFLEGLLPSAKEPFFGSPAVRPCDLIRGFASPPHDGFAILGRPSGKGMHSKRETTAGVSCKSRRHCTWPAASQRYA
jgi:hypothetical protein